VEEKDVSSIEVDYNWNSIMVSPKLVCYDKNQWKTLQQLNNWNREWSELFTNCYALTSLSLNIECSWMDTQFAEIFLGGVARVPNLQSLRISLASKKKEVGQILEAVEKAKIFPLFEHQFRPLC
jgi:hypothetical protein